VKHVWLFAPKSVQTAHNVEYSLQTAGITMDFDHFVKDWEEAWNSHNLKKIMSHYRDDIVFRSRKALLVVGTGEIHGKAKLEAYWRAALERQPNLRFTVQDVFRGLDMLALSYVNQKGEFAIEILSFDADGMVYQAAACHKSDTIKI
jgi:ketosteroid isomerase-like protein